MERVNVLKADVIIIGSGLAGLIVAEQLSDSLNVIILTKSKFGYSNSEKAQGGIAAAIADDDSSEEHLQDTLVAGSGHNDKEMVELLVQKAPTAIEKLKSLGVLFDMSSDGKIDFGQEGGHHKRRIVHAGGDATGHTIMAAMKNQVANKVRIYEQFMVYDALIEDGQCIGVYGRNDANELVTVLAPATVIATGGAGQIYEVTSNSLDATGDGMAIAYRAGARLADMEFIQFHPTMLVQNNQAIGLISEAVRGEGGVLVDNNAQPFMAEVHPLADLAPRHIVAKTIFDKRAEGSPVYLDISAVEHFQQRFPTIFGLCQKANIEVETNKLEVAPGAHFFMGGIVANSRGETDVKSLYVVGEAACTGVHGANRLASNSLLECVVFAIELSEQLLSQRTNDLQYIQFDIQHDQTLNQIKLPKKKELQALMSAKVGIVRTKESLEEALQWFAPYRELLKAKANETWSKADMTVVNMLFISQLVTSSAYMRTESRGGHVRGDYPVEDDKNWLQQRLYRSISDGIERQAEALPV